MHLEKRLGRDPQVEVVLVSRENFVLFTPMLHEVAATRLLIWTAGTTPAPVLASLPCAQQSGRVLTNECMPVANFPGVWALGDCASVPDPFNPGKSYPPTAQHAARQGEVLADNIAAVMRGEQPKAFRFKILGLLASIGRRTAVAEIFGLKFSGIFAWIMWRGIYLSKLPGLQRKVRVAIDWTLDLFFSKDIVQLPTLPSPAVSAPEGSSAGADSVLSPTRSTRSQ